MKYRKLIYSGIKWIVDYLIFIWMYVLSFIRFHKVKITHIDNNLKHSSVVLTSKIERNRADLQSHIENNYGNENNCLFLYYDQNAEKNIESFNGVHYINIGEFKEQIISLNDANIGIISLACVETLSNSELLKLYLNMKRNKADIVYVYVVNLDVSIYQYNRLLSVGFDGVVILSDNKNVKPGEGYIAKKKTHLYKHLDGNIRLNENSVYYNAYIEHKFKLVQNVWKIYSQNLTYSTAENRFKDEIKKHIFDLFLGVHFKGEEITLGLLVKELGIHLPEQLKQIEDFTVYNLCARIKEVGPNSIFFFRQPLRHNNDVVRFRDKFYIRMAFLAFFKGAMCVISYRDLPKFIPHIVVDDSIEAHISAIDWIRKQKNDQVKMVCVTGSIGKTSTKDMLFSVVSQSYRAEKSERNTNVQAKIGINLQKLSIDTEIFIQEVGGGRPGGASKHSRMVSPHIAVITNIGTAHIGNFKSKEGLLYNKLAIEDGLCEDGVLFLNGDDELLWGASTKHKRIYFAIDNKSADCYAENIIYHDTHTEFIVVSDGERVPVVVNVPGSHNVLNAVCCFAIGKYLGMNNDEIVKGIAKFATTGSRQNIINVGGLRVYADCFNASYESVISSLSTIEKFEVSLEDGRRVAVIGELTGLGKEKEKIYVDLAKQIDNSPADTVIYYTDNDKANIPPFTNSDKVKVIYGEENLIDWVENNITQKDVLLFKGSSKLDLDVTIDTLFGTDLADERFLDQSQYEEFEKEQFVHNVFEKYTTLKAYYGTNRHVKVNGVNFGRKLKKIADNAFYGAESLETIELPTELVYVGDDAFNGCINMTKVDGLENVKCIGKRAFYRNSSLKTVNVGTKIMIIAESAFEACSSLEKIEIPPTVMYIGENAFKNCTSLKTVLVEGTPIIEKNAFDHCENINIVYKEK